MVTKMNTHAAQLRPATASPRTWFRRAIALTLALAALLYGLMAIDAGVVNFRGAGNADIAAKRMAALQAAEDGKDVGDFFDVAGHSSVLLGLLAKTASPQYAYGKHGLSEALIHYATMPKFNGIAISMHSMLAGVCMLFGAVQFWPALRRRYPRWHRTFGVVYMVAAQSAMIAATVYLVRTPIVHIYDQLTFFVGLWFLVALVNISLWMSIYALWRKQIAQHQGWMCLNYGLLLTAPVQRYGWLAFGVTVPQIRQLEANYAVSDVLIPLSLMVGYALFTLNRWQQSERSASAMAQVAKALAPSAAMGKALSKGAWLVLLAASASTVNYFLLNPSLSQAFDAQALIPAGIVALHDTVVAAHAPTRWLFAAATLMGLLSGMRWLWACFVRQSGHDSRQHQALWVLTASGALVGLVLISWGLQLGMPSFAALAGGAVSLFGGALTLIFAALLAFALRRGHLAWAKEWAIFLLTCLVATPSFYWQLPLLASLQFDAQFVQAGHVYRMAESGAWFALVGAFVYAIRGEATHSRMAR